MFRSKLLSKVLRPLNFIRFDSECAECSATSVPCNTQLTILPNGMRVASETSGSNMACISLVAEAGSRYEKACNNGITHFIEHLAYKGFITMTKYQLQDLLLCIGAKLSVHTSRELQVFSARCLPESTPFVIDIFSKVILEPAFSDCEIEAERYNICLELLDMDNDPKQVVFDYLHQAAFQGTPLAQPVIGPTRNLDGFDSGYCSYYLSEHYQPYKLAMIGTGCVSHGDMVNHVISKFGCMEVNPNAQSDEGPARYTGSSIIFRDDSLPFAHVAIAVEAPGYTSMEYFTLLAASCIVGSWERNQFGGINNASPVAQAAAFGNMCEKFESFYITYRDTGLWGIYFVSKGMDIEDMLANIQNCWMNLCTIVQYPDVQRGVNAAKLKLAKSLDGAMGSCRDLGSQIMYRCGRMSLEECYHALDTVDHHGIREICQNRIYDRCPVVAAVGPTEGLPDYNRIRSGMYWLRL